jgi:hypothetical protein
MNSAEKIKRLFAKSDVRVNSKLDDRIINDALTAIDKFEKSEPISVEPNIWRIIMKNRITKLATAGIVIVILSAGIYLFTDSGTSVALGQVKAAMEKIDWVHSSSEGTSLEGWFAFESKVIIEKQEDGTINYFNFRDNRQYFYDPGTETIEIAKIVPEDVFAAGFEDPFFKRYDGPFEYLADTAKLIRAEGGKFMQSTGEYEGKKVVIWDLSHKNPGYYSIDVNSQMVEAPREEYGDEMIKVFIDAKKHLPLLIKTKFVKNGKLEYETHTRLEYPEVGPKDIYDLGVPKSAQIADRTQQSK